MNFNALYFRLLIFSLLIFTILKKIKYILSRIKLLLLQNIIFWNRNNYIHDKYIHNSSV